MPPVRPVRLAVAALTADEQVPAGVVGTVYLWYQSPLWLAMVSVAVVSVTALAVNVIVAAVVKLTSAILSAALQPVALYTSQVWAVPAARLARLAVSVLAATETQVPAGVAGTVFLCHQSAVQLDRVSVAVVCVSEPAVKPTVEKVSLAISVVQPLSLYAFQV